MRREDVIEAAIACISQEGPAALGINRVARALGIKPPSLYHHVGNNEDLARLVAIKGWERLAASMSARPDSQDPASSITALAVTFRRFVRENPGLYQVMSDTRLADDPEFHPVGTSLMSDFAEVLSRYGLQGDEVVDAVRMLRATLHGFVLLELSGQFGMPQAVEASFQWLIVHLNLMLERSARS